MSTVFQTHGAASWIELHTGDVDKAKKFYGDVLGWKSEAMDMPGGQYSIIKNGDDSIGGVLATEGPAQWLSYITVDDVNARTKQVAAAGGKVLQEPTDVPNVGRMSVIQDPTGATLCLMTYG